MNIKDKRPFEMKVRDYSPGEIAAAAELLMDFYRSHLPFIQVILKDSASDSEAVRRFNRIFMIPALNRLRQ